jgi:hypothetical protein
MGDLIAWAISVLFCINAIAGLNGGTWNVSVALWGDIIATAILTILYVLVGLSKTK